VKPSSQFTWTLRQLDRQHNVEKMLIYKLSKYGEKEKVFAQIKSRLKHQRQRVILNFRKRNATNGPLQG